LALCSYPMRRCFVALPLAIMLVGWGCAAQTPRQAVGGTRAAPGCPSDMAAVPSRYFCIDRYEDYVVEVDGAGHETPHSPYQGVDGVTVRAKNAAGVVPQGYISLVQAAEACKNSGKRLCAADEFVFACSGGDPDHNDYPYGGKVRQPGACNEGKGSSMVRFYGENVRHWTWDAFNDPRLNQWSGGLAKTGSYPKCVSPFGIYDCVGNLHEWVDESDPQGRGRFRGGFYGDAQNNGPGCKYVTHAHMPTYHDYSTGFRCCADKR
jgi:sulfatase modifying factor 1